MNFQPPLPDHQNGEILGYYIGYKEKDSQSRFIYITKSIDGEFLPEVDIHNLEKFTEYTVHVQAYNQLGRGPPSPDAQVFTLEDGKSLSLFSILSIMSIFLFIFNLEQKLLNVALWSSRLIIEVHLFYLSCMNLFILYLWISMILK